MKTLLIGLACTVGLACFAQKDEKKKDDKKNEKSFYKDLSYEAGDYKVDIVDAVGTGEYIKFKIRIFNKTNDYLVLKPEQVNLVGNGQNIAGTDKQMVIVPNDESSKVIDFRGSNMQLDKFTLDIKGIYKVAANSPAINTPNFDLPASKNDFKAGNYDCKMEDSKMKTDKTTVKFGCTYTGDGIGILDPYKCAAVMSNGKENANAKHYKGTLMEKGKYEDFFVQFNEMQGAGDMQKGSISIKWNDTFRESKLTPLKPLTLDMVMDAEKAKGKK